MTTQMNIPRLYSFSGEEVYILNDNINQGTHLESTWHNVIAVLVDQVLPEPEDDVVARYLQSSRQERDQIWSQRNQMSLGTGPMMSSVFPSPPCVPNGESGPCGATNLSSTNLNTSESSHFCVHLNPYYRRTKVSAWPHITHMGPDAPWANMILEYD